MLRRVVRPALAVCANTRCISTEHKEVMVPGAPTPPMIPPDPVIPMDFNPHIEWYEFPKEMYDPWYPFTREECLRMVDERYDYSSQELAEKYGVFLNATPRFLFWCAYLVMFIYLWTYLWGCYRSTGAHPKWQHWLAIVKSSPDCPTIHEDEIYLDQWLRLECRQKDYRLDMFWQWKPLVKENAHNPFAIELEYRDPSEWKHMTSRY